MKCSGGRTGGGMHNQYPKVSNPFCLGLSFTQIGHRPASFRLLLPFIHGEIRLGK